MHKNHDGPRQNRVKDRGSIVYPPRTIYSTREKKGQCNQRQSINAITITEPNNQIHKSVSCLLHPPSHLNHQNKRGQSSTIGLEGRER